MGLQESTEILFEAGDFRRDGDTGISSRNFNFRSFDRVTAAVDIEMANENKIKVTKSDGQEVLMKVTS